MRKSLLECQVSKDLIKIRRKVRALLRVHKVQMDPIPRKRLSESGSDPNEKLDRIQMDSTWIRPHVSGA